MAEKVLMIALSPTMEQGTIVSWQKKEGETIAAGDLLCQVETDKATMDYESSQEGTLLKILVGEGSQASVGDAIAIVGNKEEDISSLSQGTEGMPPVKDTVKDNVQDTVSREESPAVEKAEQKKADDSESSPAYHSPGKIRATPLARKLAQLKGIELASVRGSGPQGRIIRDDVEQWQPGQSGAIQFRESAFPSQGLPEDKHIPVGGKRAVIAKRLAESKFSAPHFYLRKSVFMETILQAREKLNTNRNERIGLNAFFIKLSAEAIKRHPVINSSWAGDEILQHASIDIGLAVAVPDGLVVPVVRNCGGKGIIAIDAELRTLIDKARANTLTPDDYSGATFTLSNLGAYGIDEFTAIINPPGSAILAIGAIKKEPAVESQDLIVVRQVLKLTLSCDHRVIDGAAGADYLKSLTELMEDPLSALY